ncbi:MAE_28990/MAE_18760 family HEPN-like nuclease [Leptolyngbya boryana CZ1]|uniref:MAE_28990/MAE_18760 family HEPN-like nuclease n=1 Tax=Leptolyngbya boryana CZ1 TaxID=3060204 RepID=A0AA96X452_LEPBY|nr:MAE_28990/MAE_18760 family HEPN-like nuclease [Leptolyngbya boryana]WNZ45185.1 MAE_28990/MAE_18760 family HEPN-like nuclease [Leptolyngbya boryana CZ1]
MSTFVYDLVNSIDDRLQEVRTLIEKAAAERNNNSDLYDPLCRATVLLIVAHLEGFVKEIAKAIISDINQFSSFRESPVALKRTFCKTFMISNQENGREVEQKVQQLINMLNNLETKFIVDPFLVESPYGNNKNPSPGVINKICANFGVKNIFSWFNDSSLDIVFSGVASEIDLLLEKLKSHVLNNTQSYPYNLDISFFEIKEPAAKNGSTRSFWETFLDQLLKSRNDIAHGSLLTNSLSVEELADFLNKVIVLKYGLVLVLCHLSIPSSKSL